MMQHSLDLGVVHVLSTFRSSGPTSFRAGVTLRVLVDANAGAHEGADAICGGGGDVFAHLEGGMERD